MGSPAPHVRPACAPKLVVAVVLANAALASAALASFVPLAVAASSLPRTPPQGQPAPASLRPAATVIVTEADDGRSLNLRRGEQLRVVLAETAGTGYLWEVERLDRRLLRPEGQTSWQDPGPPSAPGATAAAGLVGGPMQVSFLFQAVASGEGELLLRHWRPWEGPRSVNRRLRLRLRVVD